MPAKNLLFSKKKQKLPSRTLIISAKLKADVFQKRAQYSLKAF